MNWLSIVPWYYRAAVLVIALAVSFLCGWIKGHDKGEAKYDAQLASDKAASAAATDKLSADLQQQRSINDDAGKNYVAAVNAIGAFYTRCLRNNDCPGQVPAVPGHPAPTCPRPADDAAIAQLRQDCAITTQMFVSLRDAWRKQKASHKALYGD